LQMIEKEGKGVLVFMQQGEKQVGFIDKLKSYNGQPVSIADNKDYGIGAQILRHLGIKNLRLISNNTNLNKSVINAYGLEVSEVVPFSVKF